MPKGSRRQLESSKIFNFRGPSRNEYNKDVMQKTKQLIPKNTGLTKNYQVLVQELKGILNQGLYTAYKAVDNLKVQTYWQLGERIVREELKYQDRAEYGKFLVESLAEDLGFSPRLLYEIVEFYNSYPIVHALRAQLSWTHYGELIKLKNKQARLFYEQKTIQNSWSYRELHQQIKNNLYAKTKPAEITETLQSKLPTTQNLAIFKSNCDYEIEFYQPSKKESEKEFEAVIMQNIKKFLKILGEDFAFVGQQVPIKIGKQTHYIDLVLTHRGIPCAILVDLKTKKIESGDIGQMNKYVAYWRKNCQYEYEKNAIGLILCKEADRTEMAYALEDLAEKIFVATYKPKLPSAQRIRKAIRKLKNI